MLGLNESSGGGESHSGWKLQVIKLEVLPEAWARRGRVITQQHLSKVSKAFRLHWSKSSSVLAGLWMSLSSPSL